MHAKTCLILAAAFVFAAGPTARGDEKSHRKAAEELLKTMGVEGQLRSAIDQTLDMQVKANPQIAPFKEVLKKFLSKHMSWEGLKDDFVTIYVDTFEENELNQIKAFYLTPTGKKMVAKMPELMSKGMQLGAQRVAANQSELREMIQQEANKK